MNELSLFTGGGGGILGSKMLGWRPIGYVEWDKYCQRIIRQRIKDGVLHNAPIYGDIRTFISEGHVDLYRGITDIISGGFPCQPFSLAGLELAENDPRNMWPATIEAIRIIRPRIAWLENVPNLASKPYFARIIGDLAEAGYDVRWRVLSAAEMGAPHIRERLWILAHTEHSACGEKVGRINEEKNREADSGRSDNSSTRLPVGASGEPINVADADSAQEHGERRARECGRNSVGRHKEATQQENRTPSNNSTGRRSGEANAPDTNSPRRKEQRRIEPARTEHETAECGRWWETEPSMGRVVDGMANRVGQLRALGNGQVPSVAAAAWHLLGGDELI